MLASFLVGCATGPTPPAAPFTQPALSLSDVTPAAGLAVDVLAVQEAADDAEDARDFARCADLRSANARRVRGTERATVLLGAARCAAAAGDSSDALRGVAEALAERPQLVSELASDPSFAPFEASPEWARIVTRARTRTSESASDDPRLVALFRADQAERMGNPDDIDWRALAVRDDARRKEVNELLASAREWTVGDLYRAALVLQHGRDPDDFARAHMLCLRAAHRDPTHGGALRLAAASLDRYRMAKGQPQIFGTQIVNHDGTWRLYDVEPSMTDDVRAAWGVRPIARQRAIAAAMNKEP